MKRCKEKGYFQGNIAALFLVNSVDKNSIDLNVVAMYNEQIFFIVYTEMKRLFMYAVLWFKKFITHRQRLMHELVALHETNLFL